MVDHRCWLLAGLLPDLLQLLDPALHLRGMGGTRLEACDESDTAFADGGIGLVIHEGALSTDSVSVSAA